MTRQKRPRQRDEAYLDFIRQLSCIICGDTTSTEAAHLRAACASAGHRPVGKGERPDDRWAMPLCSACHREQHAFNETVFWETYNIDPHYLSLALQGAYPDLELAEDVITASG